MWRRNRSAGGRPGSSWMRLGAMAIALAMMATVAWREPALAQDSDTLHVSGKVLLPGGSNSAGGSFALSGAVTEAAPTLAQGRSAGEEFELVAKGRASANAGAGCLCGGLIFQDGFELGDTSGWN